MEFTEGERLMVVHFGELWLKGRNRNDYIRLLERNMLEQLAGNDITLERNFDRLILRLGKRADEGRVAATLRRVFGISAFETAAVAKPSLDSISSVSGKLLAEKPRAASVRIDAHRSFKQLPFTSVDVVGRLKRVADGLGIEPKTKEYERELSVSVTKEAAFISLNRERGAGGLPVGSSGRAIVLFSGGIDSPVAAWYAMKRGLEPIYVHVHAFRDNAEVGKSKIPRIIGGLSAYSPHPKVYLIPSYVFQANSAKFGKYELVLLKAFMLRLAARLAKKEGADAIVTGESLGQVASQTPSNLMAEQQGISLPILRPLIGMDKDEIVQMAKRIGTFEESIKPYKDVCSINARNPKTRTKAAEMRQMLRSIGMGRMVARSMAASSVSV